MHPAYSVIVFTCASGAGYGLLIWLALAAGLGLVPANRMLGAAGLGLALALVTAGLMSSTFHLGRPERAWRAFSQWRSSWLSREGVAAVLAYVPTVVLGLGWVSFGTVSGPFTWAAGMVVLTALATLWCTGMIYASLPTVRAWAQPHVAPLYVVLGLATGAVLMTMLLAVAGIAAPWTPWSAVVCLLAGWALKMHYWVTIDSAKKTFTIEAATGLGRFGKVRPLDPPHTQPNFVMREMGYRIGRKHAVRLRRLAVLLLFLIPVLCSSLSAAVPSNAALVCSVGAVLSAAAGVLIERWLFFAEAEHVAMLYYGTEAV